MRSTLCFTHAMDACRICHVSVIMHRYECKENLPMKHYNIGVMQKSLHTRGNMLNIANKVTLVPPCISPNI